MTEPTQRNIVLTAANDFRATFTFNTDISDFTELRFTVRESWAKYETDNTGAVISVILEKTSSTTAVLTLTDEQTLLPLPRYYYDIRITTSDDKNYTAQRGELRITPSVTR